MVEILSQNEVNNLAHELENIYNSIVFDEVIEEDDNPFKISIIDSVEYKNDIVRMQFAMHPETANLFDGTTQLVQKFFESSKKLIEKTTSFAINLKISLDESIDFSAVLVPFILNKMNIGNHEIHLFFSLAFLLSKVIKNRVKGSKKPEISNADLMKVKEDILKEISELNLVVDKLSNQQKELINVDTLNIITKS